MTVVEKLFQMCDGIDVASAGYCSAIVKLNSTSYNSPSHHRLLNFEGFVQRLEDQMAEQVFLIALGAPDRERNVKWC